MIRFEVNVTFEFEKDSFFEFEEPLSAKSHVTNERNEKLRRGMDTASIIDFSS